MMMNRRGLLKGLGTLPITRSLFLIGGVEMAAIRPASAWILVALAIASIAIQIAQMLAPKGPGIGDLMTLQTELLANLSDQIRVLHEEIGKIFERLAEIEGMIRELPHKTVIDWYETELSGQLGHCHSLMALYATIKERTGDAIRARDEVLPRLEKEVLPTFRKAHYVFDNERNEVLIPLMTATVQAEITAMLMVGKETYSDDAIRQILMEYERWFRDWLNPARENNLPFQCRNVVAELLKQKTVSDELFRKYQGWVCYRNVLVHNPSAPDSYMTFDKLGLVIDEDNNPTLGCPLDRKDIANGTLRQQFTSSLACLRDDGAMLPEPLDQISIRTPKLSAFQGKEALGEAQRHMKELAQQQRNSVDCNKEPMNPEAVRDQYIQFGNDFGVLAPKLQSLYSFLIIALNSRAACDRFYAAIGNRDKP